MTMTPILIITAVVFSYIGLCLICYAFGLNNKSDSSSADNYFYTGLALLAVCGLFLIIALAITYLF